MTTDPTGPVLWEVVAEIQDPRNTDIWHKYAFTHAYTEGDPVPHLVSGFYGSTPQEAWDRLTKELVHDLRNTERTGTLAHTHLARREFVREAHRLRTAPPGAKAPKRIDVKVQVVVRSTVAATDPEESDITFLWSKDVRFARLLLDYLTHHGPIHEIGTTPPEADELIPLTSLLIPDDPSTWVRRVK